MFITVSKSSQLAGGGCGGITAGSAARGFGSACAASGSGVSSGSGAAAGCAAELKKSPLSLPTSYLFIRELTPLKLLRRSSVLAQFGVACCPCALDHLPRQYGTKKSKMLFSFISSLRIGFNVRSDDATCLLSSRQSCKEFGHCQPPFSKRSIGLYSPRRAGSFSRWLAPTQDCPGARVVWMQAAMVDPVLDFEVAKVVTGDLVGLTLAHAVIRSSQSA